MKMKQPSRDFHPKPRLQEGGELPLGAAGRGSVPGGGGGERGPVAGGGMQGARQVHAGGIRAVPRLLLRVIMMNYYVGHNKSSLFPISKQRSAEEWLLGCMDHSLATQCVCCVESIDCRMIPRLCRQFLHLALWWSLEVYIKGICRFKPSRKFISGVNRHFKDTISPL